MKNSFLFLTALLLAQFLPAQDSLVIDAALPESEFHVAINPTDSNHIILATMHGKGVTNDLRIYYTFDQGASWQTSSFNGVYPNYQSAGDPVLAFDDAGIPYLVNLSLLGGYRTVISKSLDGGATWQLETDIFLIPTDKPWFAIDRYSSSPHKDNIYLPVVNLFQGPVLITFDSNLTQKSLVQAGPQGEGLPGIAVRKDGEVFMSMVDYGGNGPNKVYVAQYTNGGSTLVHKTMVTSFPDFTFNAPNVHNQFQPTVYTAIDNSGGPYDGRLYVAYTASEQQTPSIFDVYCVYSDDGGLTWSTPKPVHSAAAPGKHQYYSSIFVNDAGILVIDWYDRRNYPVASLQTDFYLGVSYDGGDNFTEVQLNSASMDFQFTLPVSNGFGIGEYHQLVATDHTAIAFWADGRTNDGDLNIYMAKVNLNGPATGVQELGLINQDISILSPYPVPATENIFLDIQLSQTYRLETTLTSLNGSTVWSDGGREYEPGSYQLAIPFDQSPGVYLLQVKETGGFFKTFKVVKQ